MIWLTRVSLRLNTFTHRNIPKQLENVEYLSLSDYVEQNYGITQQQLKLTDKICQSYNSQKEQVCTFLDTSSVLHT